MNAWTLQLLQLNTFTLLHTTFTLLQLKYARGYKEGYDLPDKHSEAWLKINHPQSPKAGSAQQVPSLSGNISPSPKNQNGPQTG